MAPDHFLVTPLLFLGASIIPRQRSGAGSVWGRLSLWCCNFRPQDDRIGSLKLANRKAGVMNKPPKLLVADGMYLEYEHTPRDE